MAGGKEERNFTAWEKKYLDLGYDVNNTWVKSALRYWEMSPQSTSKGPAPSKWTKNFIDWWGTGAKDMYNMSTLYDLEGDVNISGVERDNVMKSYEAAKAALAAQDKFGSAKDYEKSNWIYSKLYEGTFGENGSLKRFIDQVDKKFAQIPGGDNPEFADGIRLDRGNALGGNLRARSASLKTINEASQSLDTIIRQLELKRAENALNLSELKGSADIANRKKAANLEAMYGEYKVDAINQQSNEALWGNIIGAGLGAAAKTFVNLKSGSSSTSYNKWLKSEKNKSVGNAYGLDEDILG